MATSKSSSKRKTKPSGQKSSRPKASAAKRKSASSPTRKAKPRARAATSKSSAKTSAPPRATTSEQIEHWLLHKEIWGLVLAALGAVTLLALTTSDQGTLTELWSVWLRRVFGVGAYPVAVLLVAGGIALLFSGAVERSWNLRWQAIVGWEIIFFSSLGLAHLTAPKEASYWLLAHEGQRGGIIGWAFCQLLVPLIGPIMSIALVALIWLLGLYLVLNIPLQLIIWRIRWCWARLGVRVHGAIQTNRAEPATQAPLPMPSFPEPEAKPLPAALPIRTRSVPQKQPPKAARQTPKRPSRAKAPRKPAKGLPPLDVLTPDDKDEGNDADARAHAQTIVETLQAFGIPAQITEWHRGPVVTQFGLKPGYIERLDRDGNTHRSKIRVAKILSLTNDLALALAASPIRIEAPIPGRAMIGIEVPNGEKTLVGLRDVIESPEFTKTRSRIKFALGRDVSGSAVVTDLAKMPHLLIAGATGSGKSVCLNAIIVSILMNNRPDQVKLLLIDPKRVELTKYNGTPHLIAPVVVDIEKVILSLRWVTREMDRRYEAFAKAGVRNLTAYNRGAAKNGQEKLPIYVVVIDELADLMLTAPDDVERTICRLAQMARATGIHMVIATQRPSVDVVTGLIKANFPARVSFAVTSQVDSRVILDTPGAEKLLGQGDMLFMAPDSPKLLRIQGCFVSDQEVDALVAFWRSQDTDDEEEDQEPPWESMPASVDDKDDILQRAIDLVREHDQASASFLQRHLRIGYPRAGRLIDQLEAMGIVGPPETGGRSRKVLPLGDDALDAEPAQDLDPSED